MSNRAARRAQAREEARQARRRRRRAGAATAAAGAAIAVAAPTAQAAVFNVTNLDDAGPGSLRDAIAQANGAAGADTITFQSGLNGTIAVGAEMQIDEALDIQGPGPAALVLDGGDAGRIFRAINTGQLAISGMTLTNGNPGGGNGGALAAYSESVDLDEIVVTSSAAGSRGGGVFVSGNDITVTGSRFSDNDAGYSGGGFASDGFAGVGPDDAITITGSIVTGNEAATSGGGLALYDNYVDTVVEGSTISGNTITGAGSTYENGGGLWIEDTYNGRTTTVRDSTVTGNSAPDAGGGISFGENFYAATEVVNSTIHDNSAAAGGGIQFADIDGAAPFALRNSTVTGNEATDRGGGVFRGYATTQAAAAPLDVSSSIVSGNTAVNAGADFAAGANLTGDLTVGNSLVGDTTGLAYTADPPATVLVGADPQLGPLTDNGGPTQTRLPAATSPVINAGLANGLTTDQVGAQRTVDYPGVPNTLGSDGTDMGAVELPLPPPNPPPTPPTPPDAKVTDPFLSITSPQVQGRKRIVVELVAGAGESVKASAWGLIRLTRACCKGQSYLLKREAVTLAAGERTTLELVPRRRHGAKRVLRALRKGKRKITAEVTGHLEDDAANVYQEQLSAKLTPKR